MASRFRIVKPTYDWSRIYVDGAHNAASGEKGWASVVDAKGQDLINAYTELRGDVPYLDVNLPRGIGQRRVLLAHFTGVKQQVNGAELIALVFGLRLALLKPAIKYIGSDSAVVISWSTRLTPGHRLTYDSDKLTLIDELQRLRRLFTERGGVIEKISGASNPADLGYH